MINVQMSDDIRKFETKTVGPFTTRQLVCILIALVYSVPIAIFLPVSIDNKVIIASVVAIPVVLCGYVKLDGLKFEQLILRLLYLKCLTPPRRKYKCENTFRTGMKRLQDAKERKRLRQLTPKQQKAYLKAKEQRKQVVYSNKKEFKIYR